MNAFALEAEGISKFFPGVKALDNVSLRVRPGTVHALMGENGAGKSTLMKCLIGIYRPDKGAIRVKGEPVQFQDTMDALRAGISMIHQELNLVPHMTVAENIWLGREPMKYGFVDHRQLARQTQTLLNKLNIRLSADRLVGDLSIAAQQMVEIAKAVSWNADIVIMDESYSLRIVDRKKDMILVSGFNVYPNEIEDVVMLNYKVAEVVAIGVPHEVSGETIKIFVVKKDDSLTRDELRQHCRQHLTGYKVPKDIEFRDELPKSNVGKILRRILRDEEIAKRAQH